MFSFVSRMAALRPNGEVPAPLSRRGFVRHLALGASGAAMALIAACGSSRDKGNDASAEVTVAGADVPATDAAPYHDNDGGFYLVHNDAGVLALSQRCTHQGCTVPWKSGERRFHCPCHGSTFDRNGVRTDGPAKRPLDLLAARVLPNGDVAVSTHQLSQRTGYDPSQAVRYP